MKTITILLLGVAFLAVTACSPSAEQLKKTFKDNPDVLFEAIKADPKGFLDVVNNASRNAQVQAQEEAEQKRNQEREEQFENPLKPEVSDDRPFLGPKDAPVTIVEYSDFECPYCKRGYETVKQTLDAYGDKVRLVFKHLPLDFHPKAMPAAKLFVAIGMQSSDKAYKFHDEVFKNQGDLREGGEKWMKGIAKKLGVDMKKLEKDLGSDAVKKVIEADIEEAKKFGITGTPGFIINGVALKGAYPFSEFKKVIDKHLEKK